MLWWYDKKALQLTNGDRVWYKNYTFQCSGLALILVSLKSNLASDDNANRVSSLSIEIGLFCNDTCTSACISQRHGGTCSIWLLSKWIVERTHSLAKDEGTSRSLLSATLSHVRLDILDISGGKEDIEFARTLSVVRLLSWLSSTGMVPSCASTAHNCRKFVNSPAK